MMSGDAGNASQVYEQILSWASPIAAPGFDERLLHHPTANLARLSEAFVEPRLIEAGVAVRDDEGELRLASALAPRRVRLVPLMEHPDSPPFDVLTSSGCLSGEPAALALLRDFRVGPRAGEQGYLFMALSWSDFRWLAAAGLAAVYLPQEQWPTAKRLKRLAAELTKRAAAAPAAPGFAAAAVDRPADVVAAQAEMTGPQAGLTEFAPCAAEASAPSAEKDCEPPGADFDHRDRAEEGSASEPPALVIPACSLGDGDSAPPRGLVGRLRRLAQAAQAVPDIFGAVETIVWSPTRDELNRLEFIRRYGPPGQLRGAAIQSVESTGRVLGSLLDRPPPEDYPPARAAYHAALREAAAAGGNAPRVELARAHYEKTLREQLIEPLLENAASMSDPRERVRRTAAGEILQLLLQAAPLAAAEAAQAGRAGGPPAGRLRDFMWLAKCLQGMLGGRS